MRILILGGTTEASALAQRLSGDQRFAVTLSLAGRTSAPELPAVATRSGGFGGADGLAQWISDSRTEALVDATHPFAARISANAVAAARSAGVPLVSLVRAPWPQQAGDTWIRVADVEAAVPALGDTPRRVFLTIGRQEVGAFRAAPQHSYLVRAIEPPDADALPLGAEVILQRGPFAEAEETVLMRDHAIDIVVAKNSGAQATYAKIAAARALQLPVVMIDQPQKPAGIAVGNVDAICEKLRALSHHAGAPSERGV
jgi:precorrin-6A/cobalt-precorrin-6A reductase